MPAVAAVGGAMSVASGVSAFASGVTGLSALAAGASVVGGAMMVAGAVTGNKTLSKFGTVLGIGGAIGGLATGTLGDPTKVFSGGGTLNTGGSWFGGGASSGVSGATDSTGGLISANSGAIDSTVNMGNSGFMTNGAARTGSSIGDTLSVNAGSLMPATDAVTKAATASTSVFDKLAKYDKLVNVAGGIADYYQGQQKLQQDQAQFNQAMASKQAQLASGANVNVGISAPNNYQPVQPISPVLPQTPYKTTGLIAAGV